MRIRTAGQADLKDALFIHEAAFKQPDEARLAVLPEYQRKGIGSALCEESLKRASDTTYGAVIVLGDPAYYSRFGFATASKYGIGCPFEVPDEAFMVFRLPKWSDKIKGLVYYSAPFGNL